jgi:uncharacterized membrane protein
MEIFMRGPVLGYVVTLAVMAVLDGGWLSFATSKIYRPGIGHLMADKPVVWAAVAFYLMYAAGAVYLAVLPGVAAGGWASALVRGAVLGVVAYGTYDLTSLAILQGWPVYVTVADMVWGAVLTGVAAAVGAAMVGRFG